MQQHSLRVSSHSCLGRAASFCASAASSWSTSSRTGDSAAMRSFVGLWSSLGGFAGQTGTHFIWNVLQYLKPHVPGIEGPCRRAGYGSLRDASCPASLIESQKTPGSLDARHWEQTGRVRLGDARVLAGRRPSPCMYQFSFRSR
jgi:hypothetical protein